MRRLFEIEWIKSWNYASFKVILILHFFLFIFVISLSSQVDFSVPGFRLQNLFQFPNVWENFAYVASWFNLFLGILVIILTGNEYSFRTFRQQIIDGLTRDELLWGKGIIIIIIGLYATLMVFMTSVIFGIIFTNNFNISSLFDNSYILLIYFIQAVGYMVIAMLINVLIKNNALSIVLFLGYFALIEPIIRWFFPRDARLFFPIKVISNLTPVPEFITQGSEGTKKGFFDTGNMDLREMGIVTKDLPLWSNLLLALGYIGILFFLIRIILKKNNF